MTVRNHLHAVPNRMNVALDNSLSGVVTALTELPEWKGVLGMNDFTRQIVFRREPPYREGKVTGRSLVERDFDRIRLWFEDSRGLSLSKRNLLDAARIVASWNAFHPVRAYLDGLLWDGEARLATWLEDYCAVVPASDRQRTMIRAVAQKWMIACVARAVEPGSKVDTMLIFEGKQGIGKSTAFKRLASGDFYGDTALDFRGDDPCRAIQGVWIYELPELASLLRNHPAHAKAFLSSGSDRFRSAYSRVLETVPRSVVFCGTVNHGGYLRDTTGNRRFWIVRCEDTLRTEALGAARDALWAEACVRYHEGCSWHLTREEEEAMAAEQEGRLAVDPWEEALVLWTDGRGGAPFTMTELLEEALQLGKNVRTPAVTTRISAILENLGYERTRSPKPPRSYSYVRSERTVHPSICPTGTEDLFCEEREEPGAGRADA